MSKKECHKNNADDNQRSDINNFNPNFYNPFEIKHRRRTSRTQFKTLEKAFVENPKPNGKQRQKLAENLSMSPRGVQVWFQNRRAKAKQQQQQQQQQQETTAINDTETTHQPIILSAVTMAHSRSQSSSSTSSSSFVSSPSSFSTSFSSFHNNQKIHMNKPTAQEKPWYTSEEEEEDTNKMTTSPSTHMNCSEWYVDQSSMASLIGHQAHSLNELWQVIGDNTMEGKADPFTINEDLADPWAYNHSLSKMSHDLLLTEQDLLPIKSTMDHANHEKIATRSFGNNHDFAFHRNVDDWIQAVSSTAVQQTCPAESNLPFQPIFTRYIPLQQDEAYWAGQQIMRRLSESNQSSTELQLTHSYYS